MGRSFSGARVSFAANTYELTRQTQSGFIQTVFRPIGFQTVSTSPTSIIGGPVQALTSLTGQQKITVTAAGQAFNTTESGQQLIIQLEVDGNTVQQSFVTVPLRTVAFDGSTFAVNFVTVGVGPNPTTIDLLASTIIPGVTIFSGGMTVAVVAN
jgi:hypothetical protein